LESLIGTGKQLQGRNKNGYPKTMLAMAASAVKSTGDMIQQALATIQVRDVHAWGSENLGLSRLSRLSLQSQRQRALPNRVTGTKPD
jgi:hypothetical protein